MTGEQRRALAAAVERILPSDDGPGAAETGAAAYVERLLETNPFRSWQPLFEDGLDRLEELATEFYGRPFPAGSPEERDEVLRLPPLPRVVALLTNFSSKHKRQ